MEAHEDHIALDEDNKPGSERFISCLRAGYQFNKADVVVLYGSDWFVPQFLMLKSYWQ